MNSEIKVRVKIILGFIFFYSGLFFLIRAWNNLTGRRLTIVTYHRVTEGDISEIKYSLPFMFISTEALNVQLHFYKKYYRLLNFEQLSSFADKGTIPPNSLVITFDDGYRDNRVYALPLIRKHSCPWIIFLATGFVGSNEPFFWDRLYYFMEQLQDLELHGRLPSLKSDIKKLYSEFKRDPSLLFASLNEQPTEKIQNILKENEHYFDHNGIDILDKNRFMDWKDVEEVKSFTEYGAHTHLHLNLTKLDEQQARNEIRMSKKILEEKTGKKALAFSYPMGKFNESLKAEVKATGYRFAVTVKAGINDLKDPYCLKRINIWEGTVPSSGSAYSKGWLAYKLLGF